MKASSEHIKEMLIAEVSVDTITFKPLIGILTASSSNCIVLSDYSGAPALFLDATERYEKPSVQVRVRANNYVEGWNLCESIKNFLHGRANESWDGVFYTLIKCLNGPMFTHQDENQRIHFVLNFDIQRTEC